MIFMTNIMWLALPESNVHYLWITTEVWCADMFVERKICRFDGAKHV